MSAPYITPEGFLKLKSEYNEIWKRRGEVVVALSDAAAEGDRSENAEYIYRKKELRQLDSRIRYLQKRLADVNVVTQVHDKNHIYFGAWVTLEDEAAMISTKRIVGYDELEEQAAYISIDSPLARALLKKTVNEVIEFKVKNTHKTYKIISVSYP